MEVSARWLLRGAALAAAALPLAAQAHSFGRSYNLPVPLWLYAWSAAAALVLSFVLIGVFLTAAQPGSAGHSKPLPVWITQALRRMRPALRGLALALLLLAIASGLWGTTDAYRNFNMTWFWVMFVLGLAYLNALVGDVYAHLNPWATLARGIARVWPGFGRARCEYPAALGHWPAFALYVGFIAVELFGRTTPHTLSLWLLAYTALTLLGMAVFGTERWLRQGEFFGVFLRLLGLMAPLHLHEGRVQARWPFTGLLAARAEHPSLLLFVLFMLASTAFDGLHATVPWFQLFWSEPLAPLRALAGTHPTEAYARLLAIHKGFESLALLAAPLIYLAAYLLCLALTRVLLRNAPPLATLALRFAYSLLPIAFVYHLTHYFTLLLTQGLAALPLLLDPFGRGWNLFGSAALFRPVLPEMAWVWHSQVALILAGHVASVWIAHAEALRLFGNRRDAAISQLPMLALMVAFTVAGLWILALPLQPGG